uniref:Exonuclease domain-containing protein n=1 Tax=Oryza meridionalis TaxID=40149 RepID=A0A0E0E1N6_9ORYZ
MALARVSPPAFSSPFLIHSLLRPFSSPSSVLRPRVTRVPHHRGFAIAAALSQASPLPSADGDGAVMEAPPRPSSRRPWKPTCLYYTQGKCTMYFKSLKTGSNITNFGKRSKEEHSTATGMMTMMRELQMPIVGSHHLGIDDAKNIARVVQRMLADGAVMQITAKRQSATGDVKFLFKNRIR